MVVVVVVVEVEVGSDVCSLDEHRMENADGIIWRTAHDKLFVCEAGREREHGSKQRISTLLFYYILLLHIDVRGLVHEYNGMHVS